MRRAAALAAAALALALALGAPPPTFVVYGSSLCPVCAKQKEALGQLAAEGARVCLLYTSPSPRD